MRKGSDFERVYESGKRLVNPLFVAFVIPTERGKVRFGVVASRKVGGAVKRNRAKRLLREVVRRRVPPEGVSADVVLVARKGLSEAAYREVEGAYVAGIGRWFERNFSASR